MPAATSFSTFISDKKLLGNGFRGDSWRAWDITMKAALGERLSTAEADWFKDMAGRPPPPGRVRELWLAIGRRAGKDSIAAGLATWMACCGDFERHLRPGERATICCLAVSKIQAQIVFGYIKGNLLGSPLLADLIERISSDGIIELTNNVDVHVLSGNFRSLRGRTIALCILDEVAYFRAEDSASPDVETYRSIVPSLTTLRKAGSMIVGISTVYRRSGLLFDKISRHLAQPDPNILAVLQPSVVFNPLLAEDPLLAAEIEEQRRDDPEGAAADWDSIWRSDIADFVSRDAVEAVTVPGRFELPPQRDLRYAAFADPSGGSSDSMTLAVGHRDPKTGVGIVDCLREIRPPFSPSSVVSEFVETLRSYRVSELYGDRYAREWVTEAFRTNGIRYTQPRLKADQPAQNTSQLYLEFLPLLNSGLVELLDNKRLFSQLVRLERRTTRTGKDSVGHPAGLHDDLANVVAGLCVMLGPGKRQPMSIDPGVLARSAQIFSRPLLGVPEGAQALYPNSFNMRYEMERPAPRRPEDLSPGEREELKMRAIAEGLR